MTDLRVQLEQAIAALERQRPALGDDVVGRALEALKEQLAALQGEPEDQQLRQVTVLFADVVDSTALSQHLDPEDVNAVMDGALQRLTLVVEAHQGKVLQYAGDSVLAVFGAGGSREDDPMRAVRAGLAILAEGRALEAAVRQRHGQAGFNLRVGIHTGAVLLGGGVDGSHSIRGMTVNIAARMEQTAPPGGLRISHDTYRQVRGLFDTEEQVPLQVKGSDDMLVTYLVQGASRHSQGQALRGVDGVQAPLLGREAEFELLQQAWRMLALPEGRALTAVTFVAEAGLGKSRLLAEFHRWVDRQGQRVRWLEAHASERGSGRPYGVLYDLFAGDAQILDSDAPPLARAKWIAAIGPLLPIPDDAAVLGHLLGLDFSADPQVRALLGEAEQLRDRAFFHAAQLLRSTAADATAMLLMFDDLHWADDGTLDFIDHLLTTQVDLPHLLIGLTRPTLYERRPGWGGAWAHHRRADLAPLAAEQANALAEALLRKLPEVPDRLRLLVTESADGNPYYIEELVNMLIDQGAIVAGPGAWQLVPDRLGELKVPTTLTGVLQARVDSLPADELRVLELAAVVGHVFWDDALLALGVPSIDALQGLVRRELVVERAASSLEGKHEYSFRHHAMHRVSYERVLKHHKRPAHARVAQWLAAQPGQTHLDQIAEHFERGGEPAQALDHWQLAAEAAHVRFALAPALHHIERALALVPADAAVRRWDLTYRMARVLDYMSAQARLATALDELDALSARLGDPMHRAHALERRARHHYERGDAAGALRHAEQAIALAEGSDAECAVRAQLLLVSALGRLGRYGEARAVAPLALARARAACLPKDEAAILNEMGNYAVHEGDFGAAMDHLEQALALHRQAGDRLNEGGTLANLAFAAMRLGDYATAQRLFMQALGLSAAIGQRRNEGIIRVNLSLVLLNLAQAEAAQDHARQALVLVRAAADRWGEAAALRVAGQAALVLGDADAATELLAASRDLFDELEMPHLATEAMAVLAAAALARDDHDSALTTVQAILDRQAGGAGLEGTDEPLRIRFTCWQVMDALADARAADLLATAWHELSSQALRIGDAQRRQAFLEAVPIHRQIVAAWHARQGPALTDC
jgi:predicted ATPase/class 3 adenylate cyclase